MAINFHKKSNIHYIPKHCSGEGDGRGKKQSSWLQKFNHEHLQTSKLLVRTLLMSSLNESYLSSKHTNHEEIQTCGILWDILHSADHCEIFHTSMQTLMKYSTQSKSQKKYSRLNEIPIGKLQLPSSACSTNTLGMGQLTHSKTGLHNLNNDLFEIIDFLIYRNFLIRSCQFFPRASAVSLLRETSYCGAFPTRRPTLQHSPSGSSPK